jgi:2-hydroxychromene-2-carboxylate isomerase
VIEFYFDVTCPQAYFAATLMERFIGDLSVSWCPVLLDDLREAAGTAQREVPPARAEMLRNDLRRWASFWDLPLAGRDVGRGKAAARVLTGCPQSVRPVLARALMQAAHAEGRNLDEAGVVESIAAQHAVANVDAKQADVELRRSAEAAAARGVFGVPAWVSGGRVFFGHDRLGLLARALGRDLDLTCWARGAHDAVGQEPPDGLEIEFFHDFASPYSYVASTVVQRIGDRHGVPLRWTPILLGGLFRDIGTPEVPLFAMPQAERTWMNDDLEAWAEALGAPFSFPKHFPMRSILPLRAALARPGLTAPLYAAAWAHDRRIDTPEGLGAVVTEAGESVEEVAQAVGTSAIKAQLRENTERAKSLGACGVPTFVVRAPQRAPIVLWGQDRLVHLDAVARGWVPPGPFGH